MSKRLLLVDDEPQNLVLLEWLLAPLGHQHVRASDGKSALARFAELKPDLILLDVAMPGMDGLDVLRHIRSQAGAYYVPVVLVTAHSEKEQRLRGLEAGADDFLEKPVDGAILRTRVKTLLQLKESRDVLRRLNSVLTARNVALEHLQREQRELMAFLVHDLKNPLSVVWTGLEFARERLEAPPVVCDALEEAAEASKRLRTMIEDLLIVSRLEQSELPVRLESIGLSDLLSEVVREYARRAEEKHVSLLKSQPPLGETHVKTDRALLHRVIENILDNSLRYTPEHGRVGIEMRFDHCVEIAVSNTGPSIPPSDRKRIFEKFARLDNAGLGRGNAGLGLYFCKRVIESLGGQIEVTETPDWPTSFILRLPDSGMAAA